MRNALLAGAALLALAGCVEHRIVLRSDPAGASVYLEDELVEGKTPVTVPFVWDGTRRVTLMAEGYEVLDTTAEVQAHWYSYFPLDFFAEFLWPGDIVDEQVFDFQLRKYVEVGEEHKTELLGRHELLVERANDYRRGGSAGPQGPLDPPAPAPPAVDDRPVAPPKPQAPATSKPSVPKPSVDKPAVKNPAAPKAQPPATPTKRDAAPPPPPRPGTPPPRPPRPGKTKDE